MPLTAPDLQLLPKLAERYVLWCGMENSDDDSCLRQQIHDGIERATALSSKRSQLCAHGPCRLKSGRSMSNVLSRFKS